MVDIITLDGALTSVGAADIITLRNSLRGGVILAGDPDYEGARRVWNGNVDRRPALIARCVDASDVHHAVNFARTLGLLLAVRGGGHSAPGYGTNNGGVVIDLSPMKAISVDATKRTARAEGGVLWREFDEATQTQASPPPGAPSPTPASPV
jgi:FAD/FMN-containing dehydrogenase